MYFWWHWWQAAHRWMSHCSHYIKLSPKQPKKAFLYPEDVSISNALEGEKESDTEVCVLSQTCVPFINLKNWVQILTLPPWAPSCWLVLCNESKMSTTTFISLVQESGWGWHGKKCSLLFSGAEKEEAPEIWWKHGLFFAHPGSPLTLESGKSWFHFGFWVKKKVNMLPW